MKKEADHSKASHESQSVLDGPVARREVLKGSLALAGLSALSALIEPWALAAGPKAGGTLNFGVDQAPVGLDPNLVTSFSSFWPISAVYEPLVSLDANLRPTPGLAQSWETPNKKTYIFHLQPGVSFHDGEPLRASDVVFTLNRILNPKSTSPARTYISAIDTIEAVDNSTVKVTLKFPYAPLLVNLANFNTSIVSERAVAQSGGNLQRTMIGTGPFKLVSYQEGNSLQLAKNSAYRLSGRPYLDGVVFRIIPDQQSLLAGLQNNSLQLAYINDGLVVRQASQNPAVKLIQTPSMYTRTLSFNVARPLFRSSLVRRAIALALNRQEIVQLVESGFASPSAVLPATMKEWALPLSELPNYDPDQAKALLAQAGVRNLSFSIVCAATYEGGQKVAEVIADQLSKIGVRVKLDTVEWGNYINRWVKRDFDAMVELRSGPPDPDSYLYRMMYSNAPANNFGFSNAEVDALLDRGRAAATPEDRKKVYTQLQQLIAKLSPAVMLYTPYMTLGATKAVEDMRLPPTGLFNYLRDAWLS